MKLTKTMLAVSAIPLAMALSGCSHSKDPTAGPGGGGVVGLKPGSLIATNEDFVEKAVAAGTTLTADPATNSATIEMDYASNTTKTVAPAKFSITQKDGGAEMTVNGETIKFAATDVGAPADAPYGWENADDSKDVYSSTGKKDGSDERYVQIWNYSVDNDDKSTRGIAVVGAETPESVMGDVKKAAEKATYKGWASANTSQTDSRKEREHISGEMTMNADFGAGTVSGEVANLQGQARGAATNDAWTTPQNVNGKIIMGTAKIDSNGFSGGKLSLDATAATEIGADISGSTYSGRFYGPEANQVGGVMNIQGTNDEGKKFVGVGDFIGDR